MSLAYFRVPAARWRTVTLPSTRELPEGHTFPAYEFDRVWWVDHLYDAIVENDLSAAHRIALQAQQELDPASQREAFAIRFQVGEARRAVNEEDARGRDLAEDDEAA